MPVTPIRKKQAGIKNSELFRTIYELMAKEIPIQTWQQFPQIFKTIKDHMGNTNYVEIMDGGVVRYVVKEAVTAGVQSYFEKRCHHVRGNFLRMSDLREIVNLFGNNSKPLDLTTVKAVLPLSEPGLTFHRLPWDLTEGPHPVIDEMMNRTTNAEALRQWIGSLFFDDADRRQYVWLFGHGRNGKGTLSNALHFVFQNASASEMPPTENDKFWTSGLLGKRLVIFPDCRVYSFPGSDIFKQLTGGDMIRMERKGQPQFSSHINAKFLFSSNDTPSVSSSEADTSRAIFCHVGAVTQEFGADYQDQFMAEFPHFLWSCQQAYLKNCKPRSPIAVDKDQADQITSLTEETYENIFHQYFTKPSPGAVFEGSDYAYVHPIDMQSILVEAGLSKASQQKGFHLWLDRVHGVKKIQARLSEEQRERRYVGIRMKTESEKIAAQKLY